MDEDLTAIRARAEANFLFGGNRHTPLATLGRMTCDLLDRIERLTAERDALRAVLKDRHAMALTKMEACADPALHKPREIWMYWSGYKEGIREAMAAESMPQSSEAREHHALPEE